MCHRRSPCLGAAIVIGLAAPVVADGGWATQSVSLQPGWNLVWARVEPFPDDPVTLLGALDYVSIWSFVPGRATGDPGCWVSYHKDQPAFLNTLTRIQGDRGYLIQMNAAGTLTLVGRPINRPLTLSGQSRSLFGADSKSGMPTTLAKYFSHPNVTGKVTSVYKMNPDGSFASVSTSSPLDPNVSYWAKASQDVSYPGPLALDAPLEGLQFGPNTYSQYLSIEVPRSVSAQTVQVQALPSAPPPAGQAADAGTGADWLEWYDAADATQRWKPLTTPVSLTVAANATTAQIQVRVVRKGRAAATENDAAPALYQGLVQVSDSQGNRRLIGVGMEVQPAHGMWIGQARLTQVSKYPQPGMAEAKPLMMSLILALPGAEGGPKQLLDKAYVEVDRDGRILKYHYNAILFHQPVTLTGEVSPDGASGTLTGTIQMAADDPLNPYRHRYNPEHRMGYAISRQITLQFTAEDPDPTHVGTGLAQAAGDNELNGTYSETIRGVSLEPITVTGYLKLHRLSHTTQLQNP